MNNSFTTVINHPCPETLLAQKSKRVTRIDEWDLLLDGQGGCEPPSMEGWSGDSTHRVHTPHVWEQVVPNYDGVGWYKHSLNVQDNMGESVWRLRISAANYRADVFLNGSFVCRHDGGYSPFVAPLSEHLIPGKNELLVRVVDPPREYPIEGLQSSHPLRQTPLPTGKAGWYYSFGGLWQPVHLLKTGPIWIEDAFIQPQLLPQEANISWTLGGHFSTAPGNRISYTVRSCRDGKSYASGTLDITESSGKFKISLPDAPQWSCADPHLLELHLELHTDAGEDERRWRFGLREFTTDGKRFILNGKPIHLRGVLHQGAFPETLVFPKDKEMARKDIRVIREAGCNLSRITLRPASPMELDLCDEEGLLVIAEPPIGWIAFDDETNRRCLQEVEGMILRDRNRPSVVIWTLLNEFSDSMYARKKDPSGLIRAACELGTKLDPTRLMTANSGTSACGPDVFNGLFGQNKGPFPIEDEHIYLRNFPSRTDVEERILSVGSGREDILFISEFGTSGFPDMDAVLARYSDEERELGLEDYCQMKNFRDEIASGWDAFGLRKYFPTLKDFYHALAFDQTEMVRIEQRALRLNPRVAGYVITQSADASSEFGGIVDLWREPKRVYQSFKHLNQEQLILINISQTHCAVGSRISVGIVISDLKDAQKTWSGEVTLSHQGSRVSTWEIRDKAGWSTQVKSLEVRPDKPGVWTLKARAVCGSQMIEDQVDLTAIANPPLEDLRVLLMDSSISPHGHFLSPLGEDLSSLGLNVVNFSNQGNERDLPVVIHLQSKNTSLCYFEKQRVLRQEVMAGRSAIFVDCDLAYLHYFFGEKTPREIYANGAYAGNMGFGFDDQLLAHLGPERQIGPAYGECYPRILPEAGQVRDLGGNILALHAMPYQFGRPDSIEWGASLFSIKLGKGRVWVCAFPLFTAIKKGDPVALDLFYRLLRAANARRS